ncbi:MAG: hypothetical protein ACLUNQ_09675 [Oscillospiraceae bacterium]
MLSIIIIVTLLCLFLVPMQPTLLLTFLIGALMIVVGMGLFSWRGAVHDHYRKQDRYGPDQDQ